MLPSMRNLTARTRFGLGSLVVMLILTSALRFAFYVAFHDSAGPIETTSLFAAFGLGVRFDLRLCLVLVLPLFLLGEIRPFDPVRRSAARIVCVVYLTIATSTVVVVHCINFGNYAYLHEHLDASSLRFLHNPLIAAQIVWETYSIVWSTLGLTLFLTAEAFSRTISMVWRFVRKVITAPPGSMSGESPTCISSRRRTVFSEACAMSPS